MKPFSKIRSRWPTLLVAPAAVVVILNTSACRQYPTTTTTAIISPALARPVRATASASNPCRTITEVPTIGSVEATITATRVEVCERVSAPTFRFADPTAALELDDSILNWSQGFTVESFLSPSPDSAPYARIIEALGTSIAPRGLGLELWPSRTHSVRAVVWEHGGSHYIDSRATVPAGQWTAITLTYEANAFRSGEGLLRLYINGSPDPQILRPLVPADRLKAVIGRNVVPRHESFRGEMAKIVVWSRALTESEVLGRCKEMEAFLGEFRCQS